jgi:hypothetical protein
MVCFFNNSLAKWGIEKIASCSVLPVKVDRCCNTQAYIILSYNKNT